MFLEGGISKSGEGLDLAAEMGIVEKRGAFFRYKDGLLGQGRENAKAYLCENRAVRDEIEDAIRLQFGMPSLAGVKPQAAPASNGNGTGAVAQLRFAASGDEGFGDDE